MEWKGGRTAVLSMKTSREKVNLKFVFLSLFVISKKFHIWNLKEIIFNDFVSECKEIIVMYLVECENNVKL